MILWLYFVISVILCCSVNNKYGFENISKHHMNISRKITKGECIDIHKVWNCSIGVATKRSAKLHIQ